MEVFLRIWKWISGIGAQHLSEPERRTITILNRINFFIIIIGFLGFVGTVVNLYYTAGDRLFGIGSVRLLLVMAAGISSFVLVASSFYYIAKILTSLLPVFFLVVLPTLLGNMAIEYYFYYPFAFTASAIIPILLFPERNDRIILFVLVIYSFILAIAIDNMLSFFSIPGELPEIFKGRYFFYKLAQILIFIFTVSIVFTLKVTNTRYESILAEQNSRLSQQKSDLEKYKNSLEELVESRTFALRENETKFRSIFENANDAIFIMRDEVFFDCNYKTAELFGCRKDQIVGSTPYDFSPVMQPDGRNSNEKAFEKIHAALHGDSQRFEWKHRRLDGSLFDAEVSLTRLNLKEVVYLLAIVRDITSRKKSEEDLKASEKNFRNVFDKTKHGILIIGKDLKILAANRAVTDITGYSMDENPAFFASDFVSADQHYMIKERLTRVLHQELLEPFEYKVKFKNGTMHIIETESSVIDFYGQEVFLVMLRDVTQFREAEHKIMEAVIRTEENERSRIAQDLHDGLGPVLSTIKLYFQVYQDARDEAKRTLLNEKLKTTIDEAIKGVSEISHNISPHVFKNYGFYAALKQFIHRITLTSVVDIQLDCGKEPELDQNTGIILYRAITELINNSIKHAMCKNISVVFTQSEGIVQVDYSDDGKGFEMEEVVSLHGNGSGIQNIQNRINALKGNALIHSNIGKGMQASLKIPF